MSQPTQQPTQPALGLHGHKAGFADSWAYPQGSGQASPLGWLPPKGQCACR